MPTAFVPADEYTEHPVTGSPQGPRGVAVASAVLLLLVVIALAVLLT